MIEIPHINKGKKVVLYTLPNCPNCVILKNKLNKMRVHYTTMRLDTPEGLAELRSNECFSMQAPILQIGKEFFVNLS